MLGIVPLVSPADVVLPAIIAICVAAATSAVGAYFAQPKTKAEADQLNAAASVSLSAEAREWTSVFVARANAAEARATKAEEKAEAAEHRTDEIESALIEGYGYFRQLREEIVRLGGRDVPPPVRLEALWRSTR